MQQQQQNKERERPAIAIPSHKEVREAEKHHAPTTLFRPSTSTSASVPPVPPPPPTSAPRYQQQPPTGNHPPPIPPPIPTTTTTTTTIDPNIITVSPRQQGNPMLKYIRNVRWKFGDASIIPDFLVGTTTAALYLSLRYHLLHPTYIHGRMKELGRAHRLRVVLVHVDTEDAVNPLGQVTRATIGNECTLLCGFSNQECARYLEVLKSYEHKPAEMIQKDLGTDYVSRATSVLTTVRGVNKTDVKELGDHFGSIAAVFRASEEELKACPGVGPVKAKRLREAFHEPFRKSLSTTATTTTARDVVMEDLEDDENNDDELQVGVVL